MCGNFGMIGKPTKKTPRIIRTLGLLNEQRGKDSTGIALFSEEGNTIHKNTLKASDFFQTKNANRLLSKYRKRPFISILGHTRAATVGAVTNNNAHPFTRDQFVFTHNGHIMNHYSLSQKYGIDYDVDSEVLGALLTQAKKLEEAFKEADGYFTLPFIDKNEYDNLRVAIHNNVFSFAKRNNQLYYSSSMEHLREALKNEKGFTFCQGGQDVLYSFYPQITDKSITIQQAPLVIPQKSSYSFCQKPTSDDGYDELYEEYVNDYKRKDKTIVDMRSPEEQLVEAEETLLDIEDEIKQLKILAGYAKKKIKSLERKIEDESITDVKKLLNKKYYQKRKEKRLKLAL